MSMASGRPRVVDMTLGPGRLRAWLAALIVGSVVLLASCVGALAAELPPGSERGGPVILGGPSPGGISSQNVEWVRHLPLDADSSGARLVGEWLFVTNSRGLDIWNVSDPLNPSLASFLPLPQLPYNAEEDVDTNGRVLLVSTPVALYVVDVEDKSNPRVVGQLLGADQHTWTCVLDCRWAYGSYGAIVDLKDPSTPVVAGSWTDVAPAASMHDVTEVKPGLIVTASQPMFLLDARQRPAQPKVLASASSPDGRFVHSVAWPRAMDDRWLLVGGESTGPRCDEAEDGAFMVWDTKSWRKHRTFQMVSEYRIPSGTALDGKAPANVYCTHWFENHPTFRDGGIVAHAWYEHGTRFYQVSRQGTIREIGYFLPYAGSTSAAYWVGDDVVYSIDYNRGIDILKVAIPQHTH